MYTRGIPSIVATSLVLLAGGCATERTPTASWSEVSETAADAASASAVAASGTPGSSASSSPGASGRPPEPGSTRSGSAAAPAGSVARPCRMADLRFWLSLSLPIGGPSGSGSVQMTNIAADRCRMSGYITVRWLDGGGNQMPITVEQVKGSMPGYTSVVVPGKSAFAGIRWTRSRALPSDPEIPCPPAPAAIEARLAAESTFARMAWTPGDGLCDNKAGLEPIEMIS